ncbi:endonuclease/exonuclease/phosphatase family protein [Actinopolyspora erythraea]|uniref:Endonuclease n=1 Tax=Actinopolyspora erythraea TaxID=414996 RepID=A0A099D2U0_9ACTN|nr:endonuclease/exonuclease/phosphatase family protein [Actinopolyspora erythraea]ASU77239.1 endonuclease/exonuclease/phosphatase family protein [Actinopolyspora erythraea]KGI80271.1 endonuclease [Actinopolyspora erythraea]
MGREAADMSTGDPVGDEAVAQEDGSGRARRRAPGGRLVTLLLLLLAAFVCGVALGKFAGLERGQISSALIALTPYVTAGGGLLLLLALSLRRWLTALVVAMVTAVLAVSVAPRVIDDEPAAIGGHSLNVLSANVYFGEADASQLVRLVRENDVDVLSMPELNSGMVDELREAGLFETLPHRVLTPEADGDGSGIVSRYPLRELSLVSDSTMRQPSALIDLPGERDVQYVAAHPVVPVGGDTTTQWKHEITSLPAPTTGRDEPTRILAGDFNATLDHTPLRKLLGRGYSDAAELTGEGLAPTWPELGRPWAPPVTLDHVLVSGDTAVHDYRTFEVAGTDHRAVFAHLTIPS